MAGLSRSELTTLAREGAITRRTQLLDELKRLNKFIGDGMLTPTVSIAPPPVIDSAVAKEKKRAKEVRVMSPEARAAISKAMRERWAAKKGKRRPGRPRKEETT